MALTKQQKELRSDSISKLRRKRKSFRAAIRELGGALANVETEMERRKPGRKPQPLRLDLDDMTASQIRAAMRRWQRSMEALERTTLMIGVQHQRVWTEALQRAERLERRTAKRKQSRKGSRKAA